MFIELKQTSGKMILINLEKISCIQPHTERGNPITRIDTDNDSFFIAARYTEVKKTIEMGF